MSQQQSNAKLSIANGFVAAHLVRKPGGQPVPKDPVSKDEDIQKKEKPTVSMLAGVITGTLKVAGGKNSEQAAKAKVLLKEWREEMVVQREKDFEKLIASNQVPLAQDPLKPQNIPGNAENYFDLTSNDPRVWTTTKILMKLDKEVTALFAAFNTAFISEEDMLRQRDELALPVRRVISEVILTSKLGKCLAIMSLTYIKTKANLEGMDFVIGKRS